MDILSINEFTCLFIKFFYRRYTDWANNELNVGYQPHFHIRVSRKIKEKQFGVKYYSDIKFERDQNSGNVKKITQLKKLDIEIKTKSRFKIKNITKIKEFDKITTKELDYTNGESKITSNTILRSVDEKEVISYEEVPIINESNIRVPFTIDFWDSANLNQFYMCETASGYIRKFETELKPVICFSSEKNINEIASIFEKYHIDGDDSVLKEALCNNNIKASKTIGTQTELPELDLKKYEERKSLEIIKKTKSRSFYDKKYQDETSEFASSYEVKDLKIKKEEKNTSDLSTQTNDTDLHSNEVQVRTIERKEMIDLLDIIVSGIESFKGVKDKKRHFLNVLQQFEAFLVKTNRFGYLKSISKSVKNITLMLENG
jgi:hypothetical protein